MRILHVIPSVSRVHGGPSVALETMVRASAQAGVQVDVVATDDDGAGHLEIPLGTRVERAQVGYWFFRRETHFYKFSLPLTRWLARHVASYDLLHIHALFSYPTMPAALFAARRGVPYVLRPLGTLNRVGIEQYHRTLKRVSFPLIERRMIRGASFLHYTSELERLQARELGVTQRSAVIPVGVPLDEKPPPVRGSWRQKFAPQFPDRTLFLFMARLDPIKGLDVLLPAFARVRAQMPNAALVIAGAGEASYEKELRAECERRKLADDVLFVGYVEGDTKRALLGDADVFVLPSRSENQGVAVVEAMAAGLPVLVTPEVGIAGDIVRCQAGVMVTGELLAEAMLQLAQNETRRRELGEHGQVLARDKFSIEAMTRGLMDMYEKAVGKTRTRVTLTKPQKASTS